jgi:uncharacterized protein YbjQ (UPF0145 family)/DNA-directed RNA polymerase subunit RPC12/RpoP
MALKYKCGFCGHDVLVRNLRVGEAAECKTCGVRGVIPASAELVDDAGHGTTAVLRPSPATSVPEAPPLVLSTTPSLDGAVITQYLGIVSGQGALGAHLFKDIAAAMADSFGRRSRGYENRVADAREVALDAMAEEARSLGANGVVGVKVDFESVQVSGGGSLLMVTATGTAVVWVALPRRSE